MRNRLGDHAVVGRRHDVTLVHSAIEAQRDGAVFFNGEGRQVERFEKPRRRQETPRRIFRAQPRLDSVTVQLDFGLLRQLFARRHAQLQLDEIEARDHLRHRMLDLKPRVHFHEPEAVGPQRTRSIDDEFDGARITIAHGFRRHDCSAGHRLAHRRRHSGCGRFLDHLLPAALQRAVALEQVDIVAVIVAENLHLDMARVLHELLDQHAIIAKAGLGLALRAHQSCLEIRVRINLAHAAPAAAGDRLDENRIANRLRSRLQGLQALVFAVIAGRHWHAVLFHQRLGGVLEAHGADRFRRRPDPGEARLRYCFGKACILGQEAIARVDRLRAGIECCLDDALALEIAFHSWRRADPDSVVRFTHEGRASVRVGIDRSCPQAQPAGGAHDTAGNFATVGDQDR